MPSYIKTAWTIVVGVMAVAAIIAAMWFYDPFGRRKAAETKAANATVQAKTATATTKALEQVLEDQQATQEAAKEGETNVRQAQGADAPLPPAVAAAVRNGVDRVRNANAKPDQRSPGASRKVPTR